MYFLYELLIMTRLEMVCLNIPAEVGREGEGVRC